MPALVSALKSVDLPTFGNPTIPQRRLIARSGAGAARACSFRFLRVQHRHRALLVAARKQRPHGESPLDRVGDRAAFFRERRPKYVVDDLLLRNRRVSGVTDAQAQSPEVGRPELRAQIL